MKYTALLSATEYNVSIVDRQVIFEETQCVAGHSCTFAFERPVEINNTPGIWYLSHLESTRGRIPASHIIAATSWLNEMFGKSFEPYKRDLELAK